MPGTVVFKPIEANITHNTELIGKMDPYCLFHVGNQKIKGQVCRKGGKHPQWEDSIVIPITSQPTCIIDVKDKDLFRDDKIGTFEVDLREIETQGRTKKWYPLFYKEKPAGEILLEAIYTGDSTVPVSQGLVPSSSTISPASSIPTVTTTTITKVLPPAPNHTVVSQPYMTNQTLSTPMIANEVMIGAEIPTGSIYGSQGISVVQGANMIPTIGGNYPSTYSNTARLGQLDPNYYAQEALFAGAGSFNTPYSGRFNQGSSGVVYSGAKSINRNVFPMNAATK